MIPARRNDLFPALSNDFDIAPEDPKFRLRKHEHKAIAFITLQRAHCESGGKFPIVSDRKAQRKLFRRARSQRSKVFLRARSTPRHCERKRFSFLVSIILSFTHETIGRSVGAQHQQLHSEVFLRDNVGRWVYLSNLYYDRCGRIRDNEDNIQQP